MDVARETYIANPSPTHLPSFFDSIARAHGVRCSPREQGGVVIMMDMMHLLEAGLLKAVLVVSNLTPP